MIMVNVYFGVFDAHNDLRLTKDDIFTFGVFLTIFSAEKEQTSSRNESLKTV